MLRELKEAWRIVRLYKEDDGYKGPFVVVRESMMEELQISYGRALADNKAYAQVIDKLLAGERICEMCEDCQECENHDKWLEGRCKDFLLRFPDNEEAAEAFNKCYRECAKKCGGKCSEN